MTTTQMVGHDLFQFLRPDQVHAISEASEEIVLKNGDRVFRRGDSAEFFFIVLEGQVALRLPSKVGVSLLIDEVSRGEVFGSCICFQIDTYTLDARCTADSKLLKIRASTLKGLMDEDPVMGYALQTFISRVYFKRYIDTTQKLQAVFRTMPVEAI
jgi:CRP-like cAMP-binding protein